MTLISIRGYHFEKAIDDTFHFNFHLLQMIHSKNCFVLIKVGIKWDKMIWGLTY